MEQDTAQETRRGRGGRPPTVGASVKTTILMDPERMAALDEMAARTQRSRNSLLREAVDDLIAKLGGPA